jgi:hypothetical protein
MWRRSPASPCPDGDFTKGRRAGKSGGRPAPRVLSAFWPTAVEALARATRAACAAAGPEQALRALTAVCLVVLGDKQAHLRPGALKPAERQFSVCGAFMLTPDHRHNLLLAEVGFPPEQHRLLIDATLGHPGWVVARQEPLLLANTDLDANFEQILKTSRMGSALYAPMLWQGEFLGQIVCASQARDTYQPADLGVLVAFAETAAALWIAHSGPAFLGDLLRELGRARQTPETGRALAAAQRSAISRRVATQTRGRARTC